MDGETGPTPALQELPGFGNCFGCSPVNLKGLRLTLRESEGKVSTEICLGTEYESFPGVIHGGLVATILDEVMARAAFHSRGLPAMTAGMRLRYVQVMKANEPYRAQGEVVSSDGNLVRTHGTLQTAAGVLVAAADATFFLWTSEQLAAARSGLPAETARSLDEYLQRTGATR